MGNTIGMGYIDAYQDKTKISNLEFENSALKKQVESLKQVILKDDKSIKEKDTELKKQVASLKEIIRKEGEIIAQMERELKEKNKK